MDRPRHITLEDIARQLGLSKVLSPKPCAITGISAATKARIRQVAAELGYTPNFIARNLSSRRSQTIGLLVPKSPTLFLPTPSKRSMNAPLPTATKSS
jgi:LacI family transcriptional regulator